MPNWCCTRYNISGKGSKKLHDLIKEWTKENAVENGFGTNWLGNVVEHSGIGAYEDFRCRGSIIYLDYSNGELTMDTETAWSYMNDMWYEIIKKYNLDVSVEWEAEEPGCGLYCTNIEYYKDTYNIDFYDEGESASKENRFLCSLLERIDNWSADEETIVSVFKNLYDVNSVNDCIEVIKDSNFDNIYINKWEYVEE